MGPNSQLAQDLCQKTYDAIRAWELDLAVSYAGECSQAAVRACHAFEDGAGDAAWCAASAWQAIATNETPDDENEE